METDIKKQIVALLKVGRSSKIHEKLKWKLVGEAAKRPVATMKKQQDFLASVDNVLHVTIEDLCRDMNRAALKSCPQSLTEFCIEFCIED